MSLGSVSLGRLATCEAALQRLVRDVASHVKGGALSERGVEDITVLCGHRGEAEQNEAFRTGASKLPYPRSKHNRVPSAAVDIAPYPIDWQDIKRFEALRELVLQRATALGIRIRFISWDYPHVELV